jgi:sugar phosphate isomerase/epimerase
MLNRYDFWVFNILAPSSQPSSLPVTMSCLKVHNAMWPGLVGKEEGTDHPPISLERMLELTVNAEVDGQKYDGIDFFLFHPHIDPDASDDTYKQIADQVASHNLTIGTIVAPVWQGTVGGPAFGSQEDRDNFVLAVEKACRAASIFKTHGVRQYGAIRIDTAGSVEDWAQDPAGNTALAAETIKRAAQVAADHGERLAMEGEICWGGIHSWKDTLDLLEEIGLPETVGFQSDLAHTYLYLLGYNAPEHALVKEGHTDEEFWPAYRSMVDKLRPWTIDFHVAQNDGTVHGTGAHDKTGRHCPADDPNGKLDIVACSSEWLKDHADRKIKHICWDGCMFDNSLLENSSTWNTILETMIQVREAQ